MAYTSAYDGDTKVLDNVQRYQNPALGIIGNDPMNTPGRELRETKDGNKLPEKHLTEEQLLDAFNRIFDKKNPFRRHNVFALDNVSTLSKIIKARNTALGIK